MTITARHLMANLHNCTHHALMTQIELLRTHCLDAVRIAGLTSVGTIFHQFNGGNGITGVVLLAESHLAIHTWPEHRYVTLDVFVCNLHYDNSEKANHLFQYLVSAFNATQVNEYDIARV